MTAPGDRVHQPIDPDAEPAAPSRWRGPARGQSAVVAVVAAGGALGAATRYGAGLLWPTAPGAFPWTTLAVNVAGCAAIGVLMVLISEVWAAHRLVRPFFGTGVLGGFTTFSTYAADIQRLVAGGRAQVGLAYLAATLLAALSAVWCAAALTRRLITRRRT